MTLLLIYFLIAIVISFLCSLWEAVLLSITPSYALVKEREGTAMGHTLARFKANIDQPLAAILTLNTVAHTIGAIGVGQQATLIWSDSHPWITGILVPVAMTLGVLVLSELIPKTIGAMHWKRLAGFSVASLRLIIFLLWPLVWFSQRITGLLKREDSGSVFSRSDFLVMAEIGADEGVFQQQESDLIRNFLRFDGVRARDIMTPRTVVRTAPEEMLIRDWFEANREQPFSRIPVFEDGQRDQISGFILKDDILAHLVDGNDEATVGSLSRRIMVIPESYAIPTLFNEFLEQREHIALVVDEFGGMSGIVTMEDVIEALLGTDIIDESDKTENMQALARKTWERRARKLGLLDEPSSESSSPQVPD